MLQLLVQLLTQAGQFVGVAQILGVDFLVIQSGIGPVDGVAVGVRTFAARLRAARAIVTFRDGGFFLGIGAVIVGGLAVQFLGLGAEHGVRFGFGLAFAVVGRVLLAGLFAAVFPVFGAVIGVGVDFGFGQVQGCQ